MRVNKKATSKSNERLAGGYGTRAAKSSSEDQLRRVVLTTMLWENIAYKSGAGVVNDIRELVPKVSPETVLQIALAARHEQKLRHTPLFLAVQMAKLDSHKAYVADLVHSVVTRADQMTDLAAMWIAENRGKPFTAQLKKGLARAFRKFDEYQLAKYDRANEVKLRDVLRLFHPKPMNEAQSRLWKRLLDGELKTPYTWETELSSGRDKKEAWTELLQSGRLGAVAFLRNLRNMEQAGVDHSVIREGFNKVNPTWLLPVDFLKAAKYAPRFEKEIETLMLACLSQGPKLPGHSIFVVDTSGSMASPISMDSQFNRLHVAASMAMMAAEMCEEVTIYATAGNDSSRKHKTALIPTRHGFALSDAIIATSMIGKSYLGGGGIFTRQCLEYIRELEPDPDRIIVFSDSQDCDYLNARVPAPFGKKNYIVDVSSHRYGVDYAGVWTAEISGHSEKFLDYIAAYEQTF